MSQMLTNNFPFIPETTEPAVRIKPKDDPHDPLDPEKKTMSQTSGNFQIPGYSGFVPGVQARRAEPPTPPHPPPHLLPRPSVLRPPRAPPSPKWAERRLCALTRPHPPGRQSEHPNPNYNPTLNPTLTLTLTLTHPHPHPTAERNLFAGTLLDHRRGGHHP